jgi:hypothetical protein
MGTSIAFLTFGGLSSLFLVILFAIEEKRGIRYGERVRAVFDRMISNARKSVGSAFPDVNDHFLRELFHFIIHSILSLVLSAVRSVERGVVRIVRFNRMQVMRLRTPAPPTGVTPEHTERTAHLAEVIDHKRSVELSPKERAKKKEEAIEG